MRIVSKDFHADDEVLTEFKGYLDTRKLRYQAADIEQNRVAIVRLIEDEVLRQVVSEGEARRRSVSWDPQIKKALELVPRAAVLLRDPQTFVAERAREKQATDAARSSGPSIERRARSACYAIRLRWAPTSSSGESASTT